MTPNDDIHWMQKALEEAEKARVLGEVPVGAVLVKDEKLLASSHNLKETQNSPIAHAEILALQKASLILKSWRLTGCKLYVTLEPCPMCAGALIQSRIERVIFGALDSKSGVETLKIPIFNHPALNHQIPVTSGVLAKECGQILTNFFRNLRQPTERA